MPFLRRVTAGRNVPEERLQVVAEHYFARGGVSPINAQNRRLREVLQHAVADDGMIVYWGNRNSSPWLADAFEEMAEAGVTRAIAVLTSAYSSYSGCRQYREDLAEVRGAAQIEILKIPAYYNSPGFVQVNLEHLLTSLSQAAPDSQVLFTTHSIPVAMADTSGPGGGQYVAQHRTLAAHLMREAAAKTGHEYRWELVYQSRSGPPQVPWLEPDIDDRLRELSATGVGSVVVAPIGFVSDHMEVVQDLDTEAAQTAAEMGMAYRRVPTVGDHPSFVQSLAASIRAVRAGQPVATSFAEALPSPCLAGCCPNPRGNRPALCEVSA